MTQPVHPPFPPGAVVAYAGGPLASLARLMDLPGQLVATRGRVALAEQWSTALTTVAATLVASGTIGQAQCKAPEGDEWTITVGAIPSDPQQ